MRHRIKVRCKIGHYRIEWQSRNKGIMPSSTLNVMRDYTKNPVQLNSET